MLFLSLKGHIQRTCPDLIGRTNEVPDIKKQNRLFKQEGVRLEGRTLTLTSPDRLPLNVSSEQSKSRVNPVEKSGVATPATLDASTLTDNIIDSSIDTNDLGDTTMEENDAIQLQLHEPINLGGTICRLGSSAMLRLNVKLQEQPVVCVVDSAAEVTIISDKYFQS